MMICGLLGQKLGHSYSPQIHALLGDYSYQLFEKEPEELEQFLRSGDFHGLNVTIPYKKAVIPYCSALTPEAARLGAVNTIVRQPDGSLLGHNTDYFGFRWMAMQLCKSYQKKKVLVLGSGGASNTVCAVMRELGADVTVISRNGDNNYQNIDRHASCDVIINTTPVGMYPHNGERLVDLGMFHKLQGVMDLIYNPSLTQLLLDAQARNIPFLNGLGMLVAQAKESAQLFMSQPINDRVIPQIRKTIAAKMHNIILIGMPGCGKTTIGTLLAQRLERSFVDTDEKIVQRAGMPIPEIFSSQGEPVFRDMETAAIRLVSKASGLVISTGGGCVTQPRNLPLLHQNGIILWLQRELELLPMDGRPLSQSHSLQALYSQRLPMYEHFADLTVVNQGTPEETVSQIIRLLEEHI